MPTAKLARHAVADQLSDQLSTGLPETMPDTINSPATEHEHATLKRDMLLGHLLTMAFKVHPLLAAQLPGQPGPLGLTPYPQRAMAVAHLNLPLVLLLAPECWLTSVLVGPGESASAGHAEHSSAPS